jgi:ABC-2 type transport system permease protein
VTPLILGVIYGFMLVRSGGAPAVEDSEAPVWIGLMVKNLVLYGHVGLALFVGWTLLSRLALMAFSQEGKAYWLLKSAPVPAQHLLLAKFIVAYGPALGLSWLFMLALSVVQRASLAVSVYGLGVVALALAGAAGLNLALGVSGANLKWEDPRRMNAGWSGCLSVFLSFGYLGLTLGLFFLPPVIFAGLGLPEVEGQLIGLVLGGGVSLACALLAPWLMLKPVARLGED